MRGIIYDCSCSDRLRNNEDQKAITLRRIIDAADDAIQIEVDQGAKCIIDDIINAAFDNVTLQDILSRKPFDDLYEKTGAAHQNE
jgi:hypothetical protein